MQAMSLFAGGGIAETYLHEIGIHTAVANELIDERADLYRYRYPDTDMVSGDIHELRDELVRKGQEAGTKLLIATPPCQGMSALGKKDYCGDTRNYLIFDVFYIMDALDFDYVIIENVPKFLKMIYPACEEDIVECEVEVERKRGGDKVHVVETKYGIKVDAQAYNLVDLLMKRFGDRYDITAGVYDASDYMVPQRRRRSIIRLTKKGVAAWGDPKKASRMITLGEAIMHLPSLEAGESCLVRYPQYNIPEYADKEGYKYHNAPYANPSHVEMLHHTPTGCSAYENDDQWKPRRKDGVLVSGFKDTYTRLSWHKVCATRTMKSGNISGSNNGHPGRPDIKHPGLFTDARCLSLLELFLVSSLPKDIDLPDWASDSLLRDVVGEGVPPRMMEAFLAMISGGMNELMDIEDIVHADGLYEDKPCNFEVTMSAGKDPVDVSCLYAEDANAIALTCAWTAISRHTDAFVICNGGNMLSVDFPPDDGYTANICIRNKAGDIGKGQCKTRDDFENMAGTYIQQSYKDKTPVSAFCCRKMVFSFNPATPAAS